MKILPTALALLLLAGCMTYGAMAIDISSPIKAGETCEVAELTTSGVSDFSMKITNRGSGEDAVLEIRNGDQVLGRLAPKETATYLIQGSSLRLRVTSLGGNSWIEGRIVSAQ
jgi:hypothetical protein